MKRKGKVYTEIAGRYSKTCKTPTDAYPDDMINSLYLCQSQPITITVSNVLRAISAHSKLRGVAFCAFIFQSGDHNNEKTYRSSCALYIVCSFISQENDFSILIEDVFMIFCVIINYIAITIK